MAKVSVIMSDEDNTKDESLEFVSCLSDSTCDYVYFKRPGENIYSNILLEAYEMCIENDLDYVVLNSMGVEFEEGKTYTVKKFKDEIFSTDTRLSSKLIKKSLIKDEFGSEFDELFGWDIILSADKFAFLNHECEDFIYNEDIDESILFFNKLYLKIKDYNLMGKLREGLFNTKLEYLRERYEDAPVESKEEVYDKLNEDFSKMIYHSRYAFFTIHTSVINKIFFDMVVYSRDFDAFSKEFAEYDNKVDLFYVKEDIKEIKRENKRIKKETNELNKINKCIMNSKSWSLTKPLRNIRN